MVAKEFISVPQTEETVAKTINWMLQVGWILLNKEEVGTENYRKIKYTVGWPPEKGDPVYSQEG